MFAALAALLPNRMRENVMSQRCGRRSRCNTEHDQAEKITIVQKRNAPAIFTHSAYSGATVVGRKPLVFSS
jgi:hypothetical protein